MKTNIWNENELITMFLNELINLINHLPYNTNIRSVLKYNVISDFYDSWQFDDAANNISFTAFSGYKEDRLLANLKYTEGIVNYAQANRYVYEFIKLLKHVPTEALEDIFFPKEMFFIDESKPKGSITFHEVTKHTILKGNKVNIFSIDEFTGHLMKMFNDDVQEIIRQNIMADVDQYPPPHNINKMILDHVSAKIYMVDEFEFMICKEAVRYFNYTLHHHLRFDYNPNHFKDFINGPLKTNFINTLNDKLEPLSDFDKLFYLENSNHQFISHAPDLRYQELYDKFWKMFTFPKNVNNEISKPLIEYMDQIIGTYENYFFNFSEIVENVFYEYKTKFPGLATNFTKNYDPPSRRDNSNNFLDIPTHISITQTDKNHFKKANNNRTILPISFTYKNNSKNYSAVLDLMDSLKKNNFISSETDKKDFRRIFENSNPLKPIIWTGSLSELAFLVKLLHNEYELIENLGNNNWKITDQLFCDNTGKPFGWQRFKGQKKPARAGLLEKAAKLLM